MDDDAATGTVVPFNFGLTAPEDTMEQGLMAVPRLGAYDIKTTPPAPELPEGYIPVELDGREVAADDPAAIIAQPDASGELHLPDMRVRVTKPPVAQLEPAKLDRTIDPGTVAAARRVLVEETDRTTDPDGTTRIKLGPTVVGEHRWEGEAVIPTRPITVDIEFDTQAERQDAADDERERRRAERELARSERDDVPLLLHHFELPGPVVSPPHPQDDPDVSAVVMEQAVERKARRNHVGFDWGAEEREGPRRWSARVVAGAVLYVLALVVYAALLLLSEPLDLGRLYLLAFGLAIAVVYGLTLAEHHHVRPHVREFLIDVKLLREDV